VENRRIVPESYVNYADVGGSLCFYAREL
jgi:hypothetical protein